ncbi:MAG: ATP-dependent zinc metalloprotease FtsH [Chitinivibrionales bacterium]|nr:ATP-dependent zinc metalloprotease FtsH [Chitinivibrionales bacterium]MBD3358543.1 ATP-dependent zinc metalloprotease FtsH [Chitinivibrionales bacterium]
MDKQDTSTQNQKKPHQRQPTGGNGTPNWIWILVAALAGYYIFTTYNNLDRVELSYSSFKQQVREGNVSSVTIQGKRVRGKFAENYSTPAGRGQDTVTYQAFRTVNPGYDNERLMSLLEENGVTVKAQTAGNQLWLWALILAAPWILIVLWASYARNRMKKQMGGSGGMGGMGGPGGLFNVGKSRARKYRKTEKTKTSFGDVAGLENAKKDLEEIVKYLTQPKRFLSLGAEIPKGVLLMGPPGTGKTLLARAVAGEAGVPFYSISGSEFIEMFVGVGASRVRDMFNNAKKEQPAIIFIDELDAIGRSRGAGLGGGHDEREQTLNQILSEMDGFEPQESVVVMAATNRPDVLDPALKRPGRFDRQIVLNLPERPARKKILDIHARKVPLEQDVDIDAIARQTVGFSGADLKNLVNEASLLAGRKQKEKVGKDDFEEAADKITLGRRRETSIDEEEQKLIAYHEAGHALVTKLLPKTDPLQKVTIIPRGRALGATQQLPELDRHNLSRDYLLNRIAVSLGGRAAEKLAFDDFTNGGAHDLQQATDLARRMVTSWGMSKRLGAATFTQGKDQVFLGRQMGQEKNYSESTGRIIDEEIQEIVNSMEEKASKLLRDNRNTLDKLVKALIEHETLENGEVERILREG